jgi:Ca2+-binding EF-hand superfamily protein
MISGISDSSNCTAYLHQAQTMHHRPSSADMLNALDTDGSGGISQSELDTWAKNMSSETGQTIDDSKAISTYDSSGDGVLSSTELDSFLKASGPSAPAFQGMGGGRHDLFTALDDDGSGGISQPELDAWAKKMSSDTGKTIDTSKAISTYDSNGDGVLSSAELNSFLKSSGIKPPENGTMPPPPPSQAGAAENGSASKSADAIISRYDTNGDGVLSSSELQACLDDAGQTSSANDSSALAQAISAYLTNMGQSTSAGVSSLLTSVKNLNVDFSA